MYAMHEGINRAALLASMIDRDAGFPVWVIASRSLGPKKAAGRRH